MGISEDDGYFVCDYCGEDTGKFNTETGNHWVCEENAELKKRFRWVEFKKEKPPRRVEVLVYHPTSGFAIAEYGNHDRWIGLPDMAPEPTHWAIPTPPTANR